MIDPTPRSEADNKRMLMPWEVVIYYKVDQPVWLYWDDMLRRTECVWQKK